MRLCCGSCGLLLVFNAHEGTLTTRSGVAGLVTFADPALLVWSCPVCTETQAEDLVSDDSLCTEESDAYSDGRPEVPWAFIGVAIAAHAAEAASGPDLSKSRVRGVGG
jgi:rubredoxin